MDSLSPHNITVMFLSFGVLLGVARLLGEVAQRLRQPAVVGELLAGVILGPTILGRITPEFSNFLFPQQGPNAIAFNAITNLAVVLFLMVAGLEVDLSIVRRLGHVAPKVSISGILIPFSLSFLIAWFVPQAMGQHEGADHLTFTLFFATAMSITALPVIAKTLMDLDLYRSDLGMVIVSAAIVDDLIGWIIFAIVLGMIGSVSGQENNIFFTILLTLAFAGAILTIGRWLIHRFLPFLQAYTKWPGGILGFAFTLAMLGAAFTEWIGIHAIFGSFLVGIAIGDSSHLRENTRVTIHNFVSYVFAPLFFASIGLRIDFLANFDLQLVLLVLVIACVCKFTGGLLGAYWGKMHSRDAWAIAFAMNSRGAMEIVLGLLALSAGIISPRLFVALVIMAIVTSMISGPLMKLILKPTKKWKLQDLLTSKHFIKDLKGNSRREAIHEMATAAAINGLSPAAIETAVWSREEIQSTGIGNGVALPHARVEGLHKSVIVVGFSDAGIDFDAPDDKPANLIFMILSPTDDPSIILGLTAEIVRLFRDPRLVERALRIKNYTGFLSLIKSAGDKSEST